MQIYTYGARGSSWSKFVVRWYAWFDGKTSKVNARSVCWWNHRKPNFLTFAEGLDVPEYFISTHRCRAISCWYRLENHGLLNLVSYDVAQDYISMKLTVEHPVAYEFRLLWKTMKKLLSRCRTYLRSCITHDVMIQLRMNTPGWRNQREQCFKVDDTAIDYIEIRSVLTWNS
jgi:hypothetical protein